MAGKLKIDLRRRRILEILRRDGRVNVAQLSEALGVTVVTIRNDLDTLEREGYLVRMAGGAIPPAGRTDRETPGYADVERAEEKRIIAAAVAELVGDGDTLFLNSGTTTRLIAEKLCEKKNLNIVTNSLRAAEILGLVPTFRVVLVGGEVNARHGFTCGGNALEQLSRYRADWAILSVDGISRRDGVTTCHAEEAVVDRMMTERARRVIIAADHTKIGRPGFTHVCDCSDGVSLVTDCGEMTAELYEIQSSGVHVALAGAAEHAF